MPGQFGRSVNSCNLTAMHLRYSRAMKVTVIGTGYVGLVSGACLAEMGNDVLCLDVDPRKIDVLEQGQIPIHEPGLQAMVRRNAAPRRMRFTYHAASSAAHGHYRLVQVGVPPWSGHIRDL